MQSSRLIRGLRLLWRRGRGKERRNCMFFFSFLFYLTLFTLFFGFHTLYFIVYSFNFILYIWEEIFWPYKAWKWCHIFCFFGHCFFFFQFRGLESQEMKYHHFHALFALRNFTRMYFILFTIFLYNQFHLSTVFSAWCLLRNKISIICTICTICAVRTIGRICKICWRIIGLFQTNFLFSRCQDQQKLRKR